MTPSTSAAMESSAAVAPASKFKLKSPRSLSRLKAMRQSANSTRHTHQDQQRPPLPAIACPSPSTTLDLPAHASLRERQSFSVEHLPCSSSHVLQTSGANARPTDSTDSEHPRLTRLASLGEVRGAGISDSPLSPSSSPTRPSLNSVETTTNELDPLTASSADSTPRTSPSSSHRDLKESRAAFSAELWTGGIGTMEDPPGAQIRTPLKPGMNGRNHFSSPAGSAVRAMGRKLFRFRQSSASEAATVPLSISVRETESSRIHSDPAESSQGITATTPRQREFRLERQGDDIPGPQLPPLRNVDTPALAQCPILRDRFSDEPTPTQRRQASSAQASTQRLRSSSSTTATPKLSAESFELLDALDALMTLGDDEAQTIFSTQRDATGSACASSSTRAFPTWPHATDDLAAPRLLTEAQMARLEEEERVKKPRSILSRVSQAVRSASNRQSRPDSTVSSVSEDDYGGDEDFTPARSQNTQSGPQASQACDDKSSTAAQRSKKSSVTSRNVRNSEEDRPTVARSIVTPGPTSRRSLPGLDSPAKRALHSCTLLKIHPQLAHLLIVSIVRGWPSNDERAKGPVDILYPRSINPVARLEAASRRGGSQLGITRALITPLARETRIEVGHRHVMRKLKFQRLDRDEIVEIGYFMKDYASHYISGDVIVRAVNAKHQVSPEALARPPGLGQAAYNRRASVSTLASAEDSMSSDHRVDGTKHGLAHWATRKPFLERCTMIRGDFGTTFDVGDVVVDSKRATTLPAVNVKSPRPSKVRFSEHLMLQAGLAPPRSPDRGIRTPLRTADRGKRGISKMPPPWVAPRASAEDLASRTKRLPISSGPPLQVISAEIVPACQGSRKEAKTAAFHAVREAEIAESSGIASQTQGKDISHGRSCSQNSHSSTDESFQSAASSIHSSFGKEEDEDDVPIADLFERRGTSLKRYGKGHSSSSTETLTPLQSSSTSPPSSSPPRQTYLRRFPQPVSPVDSTPQEQAQDLNRCKGRKRESHFGIFSKNTKPEQSNQAMFDVFGANGAPVSNSTTATKRLSHQLPAKGAEQHKPQGASVDSTHRAFTLSPVSAFSSSHRDLGGPSREANRIADASHRHSHQPSPARPQVNRQAAYRGESNAPPAPSAQLAQRVNSAVLGRFKNPSSSIVASGSSHGQGAGVNGLATSPRTRDRASVGRSTPQPSSPFRSSSSSPSPGMGPAAPAQAMGNVQSLRHGSSSIPPHTERPTHITAGTPERSPSQQ
ncbi:hypothetical protein BCV69DRAFT_300065 [Microstroma glucosiphilum]|uniref:Uncharacterized protein n=1 Tax=Pseudomicrostroma glucosiphilum TaxID=1684307 RepID=A0A316U4L3_9BASI|nr:hypothetical protein BCV69DRAFT_300065 [Pseudomicrostroma glucosiphilum]PWN19758.1 hypothetical protein BCV69DRAFT_300065 [Pseudomicrostroma glucosiphilum]